MTRPTCWARAARKSMTSASGASGSLPGVKTISRIRSASGEPPGSRVKTAGMPRESRSALRRWAWVDFPDPSIPSKVRRRRRTLGRGPGSGAAARGAFQPAAGTRDSLCLLRLRGARALRAVLFNELFDHLPRDIVRILNRRRLLEVGRGPDQGAGEPVVERQLGAAHGVDDDAGGVRRIPHLELHFHVERHVAEGPPLEADVGPLAVVEPFDVIARTDVHVLLADVVVEHRGDRVRLRDLLRLQARALEHIEEVGI